MYVKKNILPLLLVGLLIGGCSPTVLRNSLYRHTGFANVLQSITFSHDGKFLAAGGWAGDNYIELYDVETLELVKTIKRKPKELFNCPFITFSPDGEHLVTAGLDDPMIIWDISTGMEFIHFSDFTSVSEAKYASDGRIQNLSELKIVWEVAYSPDGKILTTAGPKNEAHLFDSITGRELAVLSGHKGDVKCLAFSRSGKLMATGGADGMVLLWDVDSAKNIAKTNQHQSPVTSLSFSADGKTLLSTDYHQGKIWTLASFNPIEQIIEPGYLLTSHEVMLDGIVLMSLAEAIDFPFSPYVSKGQYSPDGRYLALKSYNEGRYRSLDIYQILIKNLTSKNTSTIKGTYLDFAFSPDGKVLATAGRGVKLWNPSTGKEITR
jgi:WD40 repeat protein